MPERMIEANGAEICTESFGDPTDPPILLLMGTGASMLFWEEEFCRSLAGAGRFVVRYDHRDTGRSTAYPPGQPGYTGADLTRDAVAVLDGLGLEAAHLVGISAGGGIAQEIALEHPDRALSLVLMSTSPVTGVDRALPPPTRDFGRFVASEKVDWSDRESVVEYLVAYWRVLAGGVRPFDEDAYRNLVRREVDRARHFASLQNHGVMGQGEGTSRRLSEIAAPTLVIHGSADPMFPLEHGEALADEIPDARLVQLDGAGHGVYREDWYTILPAVEAHTADAAD
jgi:pimeloyl-ACP methyl ester carboxylesterase